MSIVMHNDNYQVKAVKRKVVTAQYTTTQLFIYFCLLLLALAGTFGAGILVGKMNPWERVNIPLAKAEQEIDESATETYSVPLLPATDEALSDTTPAQQEETATAAPQSDGAETPAPTAAAPTTEASTGPVTSPDPAETTPKTMFMKMVPKKTSMDPLPSNRPARVAAENADTSAAPTTAASPTGGAAPSTFTPGNFITAPPASETPPPAPAQDLAAASPPPAAPAQAEVPQAAAAPAPTQALPAAPEPTPAPAPAPAPAPKAAAVETAAPPSNGKFGIQLAAFSDSDRSTKAETLCADVKKKTGLHVVVLTSNNHQQYHVLVVGYADRASAAKALNSVRTKTGFSDAFVKTL